MCETKQLGNISGNIRITGLTLDLQKTTSVHNISISGIGTIKHTQASNSVVSYGIDRHRKFNTLQGAYFGFDGELFLVWLPFPIVAKYIKIKADLDVTSCLTFQTIGCSLQTCHPQPSSTTQPKEDDVNIENIVDIKIPNDQGGDLDQEEYLDDYFFAIDDQSIDELSECSYSGCSPPPTCCSEEDAIFNLCEPCEPSASTTATSTNVSTKITDSTSTDASPGISDTSQQ